MIRERSQEAYCWWLQWRFQLRSISVLSVVCCKSRFDGYRRVKAIARTCWNKKCVCLRSSLCKLITRKAIGITFSPRRSKQLRIASCLQSSLSAHRASRTLVCLSERSGTAHWRQSSIFDSFFMTFVGAANQSLVTFIFQRAFKAAWRTLSFRETVSPKSRGYLASLFSKSRCFY